MFIRTIDGSSMLELRRDDLQLFTMHYSFFCVCFVLLYMGKFEFKIDSKNDSKIDSKNDSKLHSKKDPRLHSKFYNMPKFYIFFSLQVKCQILICINSLKITNIPIILLTIWERFIFQATEKKTGSKIDIYIVCLVTLKIGKIII